jgi:hypothetical protein
LTFGLFGAQRERGRVVVWTYLTVFALLVLAGRSRSSYLAPAYPPLLAVGAVTLERVSPSGGWRWLRPSLVAAAIVVGVVGLPVALPLLPVKMFVRYQSFVLLCDRLHMSLTDDRLTMIAADWQTDYFACVDTLEGQTALEPFVAPADLVIFDNRSCLFDPEGEKDPTAWQPAQHYLLGLRRRGKAVLLAHHSNRQGGARGHSKSEDALNLLVKLSRPEEYSQEQGARFLVTFDKYRGFYGPAAASVVAALTCNGWHIEGVDGGGRDHVARKIREYLVVAHAANDRPKSIAKTNSSSRGEGEAGGGV